MALPTSFQNQFSHGNLGVAAKQVGTARWRFQRSAEIAGFFHGGRSRLVVPPVTRIAGLKEETPIGVVMHEARGSSDEIMDAIGSKPALVAELFRKLPDDNETFESAGVNRDEWETALKAILNLVYKARQTEQARPRDAKEEASTSANQNPSSFGSGT